MASSYVVKVEHKGSIRRLTVKELSFEQLQIRIGDLFQLPRSDEFVLTYVDKDGDVVTMGEDEDLRDALVLQALNPLRVTVANVRGGTDVKTSSPIPTQEANSNEGTQQQQRQQSVQGEQTPPQPSKSLSVEPVAEAEPVVNSGEKVANAEPVTESVEISSSPEGKPSNIDETPVSNLQTASPPAANGSVGDVKEATKEERATENKTSETAGAAKEEGDGVCQIHFGIRCDGCGVIPISGPRFKSCRKPNYDLCAKCFETSGAEENEYAKIERLFYRVGYPQYVGMFGRRHPNRPHHPHELMCSKPDQCRKNSTVNPNSSATVAASALTKAKTTTEENSRVLHRGVQCDECGVTPIEGPRFKSSTRFNYDLCQSCFEKSGSNAREYSRLEHSVVRGGNPLVMSQLLRQAPPHCRLNPRSNRWFLAVNQLVPIIGFDSAEREEKAPAAGSDAVKAGGDQPQAESAAEESTSTATSAANVDRVSTLPAPQQEEATEEQSVDANVESKAVQIAVSDTKEGDSDTPLQAQTPVVEGGSASTPPEAQTPAAEVGNASTENVSGTTAAGVEAAVQSPPEVEGDLSTREGLLAKLAVMGFEDPKLNEELLEKNSFDLRRTLDDLCAAEEWDPILGELQEMGFYDANMNRRLMFKNKGSVKRVVKELVQMYKGETTA